MKITSPMSPIIKPSLANIKLQLDAHIVTAAWRNNEKILSSKNSSSPEHIIQINSICQVSTLSHACNKLEWHLWLGEVCVCVCLQVSVWQLILFSQQSNFLLYIISGLTELIPCYIMRAMKGRGRQKDKSSTRKIDEERDTFCTRKCYSDI